MAKFFLSALISLVLLTFTSCIIKFNFLGFNYITHDFSQPVIDFNYAKPELSGVLKRVTNYISNTYSIV